MREKIIIEGRLGADPIRRITQAGKQVCNLSIAVNKRIPHGNGFVENTIWHRVVLWQGLAEDAQSLHQGSAIPVEGFQKSHTFEGRDGVKRKIVEIVADKFDVLDSLPQPALYNCSRRTSGGVPRVQIPDNEIPF